MSYRLNIQTKVDTAKLSSIIGRLGTTSQIVDETAAAVVTEIKNNIQIKGVVDTGALLDSIEYEASGNAATIHDGVEYGFYNEFGTYKMPARPFFVPGLEKWTSLVSAQLDRIFV